MEADRFDQIADIEQNFLTEDNNKLVCKKAKVFKFNNNTILVKNSLALDMNNMAAKLKANGYDDHLVNACTYWLFIDDIVLNEHIVLERFHKLVSYQKHDKAECPNANAMPSDAFKKAYLGDPINAGRRALIMRTSQVSRFNAMREA